MYAIETKKLCYAYKTGEKVLNNIDISVKKGETVGFLGENGAGKSTLLKHFNGILKQTKGEILVEGENITKKNLKEIRKKVGFVFQNPDDQVFSPTVLEDVAFGPMNLGLSKEEVLHKSHDALKAVGVEHLINKSPHQLSVGEKRRVGIAGVLAMHPDILILDEPTANLDPNSINEILEIIKKLNSEYGITIIISTHNVNIVPRICSKVYVMNKGEIILEGSPEEVFKNQEVLKRADLDVPDISKLMLLLENDGHNTNFSLTVESAYEEIKRIIRDKNA